MQQTQSRFSQLALGLVFASSAALTTAFPARALNVNTDFTVTNGSYTATTGNPASFAWTSGTGWVANSFPDPTVQTITSPSYTVTTAGSLQIALNHRYNFEDGYDGGQLYVSRNGGAFALVPESAFTTNGYNRTINTGFSSPIPGQRAWSGASGGVISSQATDVGTYAVGDTVRFQIFGAWDTQVVAGSPNWVVTQLSASTTATPVPFAFTPLPGLLFGWAVRQSKRKLQPRKVTV